IPVVDADPFGGVDGKANQAFQNVEIQPGNFASGTATLRPLGANTQLTQHYVFKATPSTPTLTVQTGATLYIASGANVVAAENNYVGYLTGIVVDGAIN